MLRSGARSDEDQSTDHSSPEPFTSHVVIEFSKKTPQETVDWVVEKITSQKKFGGGGLSVKTVNEEGCGSVLHVGAEKISTLLIAAELMELKKPYKDGLLREIQMGDLDQFENSDDLDAFLTRAEKQRITKHELDCIRATENDTYIPGSPQHKLYTGLALIPECVRVGVIRQIYPLHDRSELKRLGQDWYSSFFSPQPIERIQAYFGETIAMYFAFLGFYTLALLPPTLIALITEFLRRVFGVADLDLIVFFSIFNIVWATIFLEAWKRNCATLAYKWGTIHTEHYEEARPEYYGKLSRNKVTDRLEPKYPKWKKKTKYYLVTVPVIALCLFLAFVVMLYYFKLEDMAMRYHKESQGYISSGLLFMPTILYAVVIAIMNAIYRKLAKILNDWENHRLQSAYENHLILKLVLFDFTNCFLSLFYVAFYLQDLVLLRSHLAALLITQQVLGQCLESLLPYLIYRRRKAAVINKHKTQGSAGVEEVSASSQAEIDSTKDEYIGTLDDYLEMFLQFGYVFLFSAVFPTAAFYALLNNITEIRTDAFKMCRVFQRPFSRPTAGIGAWQAAFEALSVLAVVTNCALISLTPQVRTLAPHYGDINIIIFFIVAEHLLLFIKAALAYLIPDEPQWVETAIARTAYQAKLAWRQQRATEAKKELKAAEVKRSESDQSAGLVEVKRSEDQVSETETLASEQVKN